MSEEKEYIKYEHKETGEPLIIEVTETNKALYRKMLRARKAARKFANYLRFNYPEYKVRHLMLSQAQENFSPKFVDNFRRALKLKWGAVCDFWTTEIQHERLEKYGEAVLHWHFIIAVPPDVDFDYDYLKRLWGRGNIWITNVRNRGIMRYILKYITKDGEYFRELGARKFGGSRIAGLWGLTLNQLAKVVRQANFDWGELEGLSWVNGRGYLLLEDQESRHREKLKLYDVSFQKEYEFMGRLQGEPF